MAKKAARSSNNLRLARKKATAPAPAAPVPATGFAGRLAALVRRGLAFFSAKPASEASAGKLTRTQRSVKKAIDVERGIKEEMRNRADPLGDGFTQTPMSPEPIPEVPITGDKMVQTMIGGAVGYTQVGQWDPNLSFNPDEVIAVRQGMYTYQEMMRNPDIRAALEKKKGDALSHPYDIVPHSMDDEDQEIAQFVRWNLNPDTKWFLRKLFQMLDSIDCGYSITEKCWKLAEDGPWAGKWYIEDLKTKDPGNYRILTDEYRNVLGYREQWRGPGGIYFPKYFAVLFSWMPRYKNPYGTSQLQSARALYEFMVFIIRSYMKHLDNFARPIRHGKYKGNDLGVRDAYFEALKKWGDEFCIVTNMDLEIDVISAVSDQGAHKEALTMLADKIAIAILGSRTGTQGAHGGGGKAQAGQQDKTTDLSSELIWMMIQDEVGEQIIKELVKYNYPVAYEEGRFPRIERVHDETLTFEEANALNVLMGIWLQALQMGIDISKEDFRDKFGIPRPAPEDELMEVPEEPPPSPSNNTPGLGPGPGNTGKPTGGDPHPGAGPTQNPGGSNEPGGDGAKGSPARMGATLTRYDKDGKPYYVPLHARRTRSVALASDLPAKPPPGTPANAQEIFRELMWGAAQGEALARKEFDRSARPFRRAIAGTLKKKARMTSSRSARHR